MKTNPREVVFSGKAISHSGPAQNRSPSQVAIPGASTGAGDHRWYKDAVIYQLHVRAFSDHDADGIGDFAGLSTKLDYLKELGVTALWLLPFYPSPLRDDGYDIADYRGIHPNYGTLADFRQFLREAHKRPGASDRWAPVRTWCWTRAARRVGDTLVTVG